jgi:1-acyl-sn-glycerol-3-phosphate acyltransferase
MREACELSGPSCAGRMVPDGPFAVTGRTETGWPERSTLCQLEALTRIGADDFIEALGLGDVRRGRGLLQQLCRWPARRIAHQLAACDRALGDQGLAEGSVWILRHFAGRLEVAGQGQLPREGPLLIAANHPGLTDVAAVSAGLPRSDLRIVAADYPLLRALHHTGRHLIYVPEQARDRPLVVREAVHHLRRGGAVLLFPAGRIEPDPAVLPGAGRSLDGWSRSIGLLVRLAPRTRVVPAVISGVLSAAAQRHPLTRLRRRQPDRQRLASLLQALVPAYQAVTVRVAFGPPLAAADLLEAGENVRGITQRVIDQARRLIERPPTDWRTAVVGSEHHGSTRTRSSFQAPCSSSCLPDES